MPRITHRTRGAAALLLALGLTLAPALAPTPTTPSLLGLHSAHALGENGAFALPIPEDARTRIGSVGSPITFDLATLLSPAELATLNLDTAKIAPTDDTEGADVTPEGTLIIKGTGTWRMDGTLLTFRPELNTDATEARAHLTITSTAGHTSTPTTFTIRYPAIDDITTNASEGIPVEIPLVYDRGSIDPSSVAFTLQGLPTGSTLTSDGHTLTVPREGQWTLSGDALTVTFTPRRERLGSEPTPVHLTANDAHGITIRPARITINTPTIATVARSAPYGDNVTFDLTTYATNITEDSLTLVPYGAKDSYTLSDNGHTATIRDQGTWRLDTTRGILTFTPNGANVRDVTPMGIQGTDVRGNASSVAPMYVGYPQVASRNMAFRWGENATFTPLEGSLNVQPSTFAFDPTDMPEGTRLDASAGHIMDVPGEGRWEFDLSTLTVTFTPAEDLKASPTPAAFTVSGVYAGNETRATLNAQYATEVPIARDDKALTNRQATPVVIDVLANDTPAATDQTIKPESLTLRSANATNIQELVAGTGKRLDVPEEGVFEITDGGAVRFRPAPGFVGRTKAIEYTIEDSTGLRTGAKLVVEVEPLAAADTQGASTDSGVNSLYARLLPTQNGATFSLFASITALFTFTGIVSLWVGRQMEREDIEG